MFKNLNKKANKILKNRRGSAAVEFAMLAAPFMFLIFALMEIMVLFFVQTTLEAATAVEARKIRTGQVQNATITQTQFKTAICARLHGLGDCTNRLFVMVQAYAVPPVALSDPFADSDLTIGSSDDEPWQASVSGDMVVVRTYYVWPLMTPGLTNTLSNFSSGGMGSYNRILMSTAAFRNEPFN